MSNSDTVLPSHVDVVIVGAGLSGLAAANLIVEHNETCRFESEKHHEASVTSPIAQQPPTAVANDGNSSSILSPHSSPGSPSATTLNSSGRQHSGINGGDSYTTTSSSRPLSVVVLEANSRVGGRTLHDKDGTDLGGTYIGPTQDRIMHLVDDLGLKLKKVDTEGDVAMSSGGRVSRYSGLIPCLHFMALLDLNNAFVALHDACLKIDPINPHLSPDAKRLDAMNVEQWLSANCWTKDAKALLRLCVRTVLCVETGQVSMLAFLHYLKQSGGPSRIFETRGGAQDSKVEGGTGQIAVKLSEKLQKLNETHNASLGNASRPDCKPLAPHVVYMNHAVREVDYSDKHSLESSGNGHSVILRGSKFYHHGTSDATTTTSTPFELRARYVILALPPVQTHRIHFTPHHPMGRELALQRYPFGHMVKTFMYYDRPFWKEDLGLCGQLVNDSGFIQAAFDDSGSLISGSGGCLMGFGLFHLEEHLTNENVASEETRKLAICKEYARILGSEKALHPVGYKEKVWATEPWVGGCYTGVPGPNAITQFEMAHTKHYSSRVFVAGTEAARVMTGYMDGAVESGERCGRNVLVAEGVLPDTEFDTMSTPPPSQQMPHCDQAPTAADRLTPSVPQFIVGTTVAATAFLYLLKKRYM